MEAVAHFCKILRTTSGRFSPSSPGRQPRCSSRHFLPPGLLQLCPHWSLHLSTIRLLQLIQNAAAAWYLNFSSYPFPHHASSPFTALAPCSSFIQFFGAGLQGNKGKCSFLPPIYGQTLHSVCCWATGCLVTLRSLWSLTSMKIPLCSGPTVVEGAPH